MTAFLLAASLFLTSPPEWPPTSNGLTAVLGVRVGHERRPERPTGCTVVVFENGAVAGVDVRGGAPGSRETELLRPENLVEKINAIVLAGGSAFGLEAATGTMRWLEEQNMGFDVGVAKVPIVPAAILFDLRVGDAKIRPNADCGYRAAATASHAAVTQGNVGAGAGATVGKLAGMDHAMKGGLGSAALRLPDGLTVAALVAVNAVGDIIDPATGRVIAGARDAQGQLLDARRLILGAAQPPASTPLPAPLPGQNTTLGIIVTNARLTKAQATKVAQMAQDGLARAIVPAHTPFDGDTVFAAATGELNGEPDVLKIGALAAEALARAIVAGIRAAESLPGLPAARDLEPLP